MQLCGSIFTEDEVVRSSIDGNPLVRSLQIRYTWPCTWHRVEPPGNRANGTIDWDTLFLALQSPAPCASSRIAETCLYVLYLLVCAQLWSALEVHEVFRQNKEVLILQKSHDDLREKQRMTLQLFKDV
eukprot:4533030-Amphidinium_carterae.1